jgi:glycosyltransferase involved in cell wall biosynthesis
MGGTTRAVTNTANMLSKQGHRVTIISTFRSQKEPYFRLEKNIKIKSIIDYTKDNYQNRLIHIFFNRLNNLFYSIFKSKEIHQDEPGIRQFSRYIEKKLIQTIQHVETDVLISTRASYNLLVAKYAPNNIRIIAQEHMVFSMHSSKLQETIRHNYQEFDQIITLTEDDALHYKDFISREKVIAIPNLLPCEYKIDSSVERKKVILSAGRFEEEKGYDLLIQAVHLVHENLNDWEVHIYGQGSKKEHLDILINQLNLSHIIKLFPPTKELTKVMNEASLFVLPSRFEGFGMVIIEAMASGLPVIAFDCPVGPRNIIRHGVNGVLVEEANIEQLANELKQLAFNTTQQEKMRVEGLFTSKQYSENTIYKSWKDILSD